MPDFAENSVSHGLQEHGQLDSANRSSLPVTTEERTPLNGIEKAQQGTTAELGDDGRWEPSASSIAAERWKVNMFGYKPKHAEPEPYRMTAKEATTDELIWFLRTKRPDGESIIHEIMAYTIETLGLEAMLSDTIMDLRIYDDYVAAQNLGGIRR